MWRPCSLASLARSGKVRRFEGALVLLNEGRGENTDSLEGEVVSEITRGWFLLRRHRCCFVGKRHHENNNIRSNELISPQTVTERRQRCKLNWCANRLFVEISVPSGNGGGAEDNHLGQSCGRTAHAQSGPIRLSLLLRLIYHNGACLKGAAFKKRCVLSYCLWAKFDLLSLPVSFMKQKKMRSFGLIKTFFSVYFLNTGARCLKRAEWNWQRQSYLEIRPSD